MWLCLRKTLFMDAEVWISHNLNIIKYYSFDFLFNHLENGKNHSYSYARSETNISLLACSFRTSKTKKCWSTNMPSFQVFCKLFEWRFSTFGIFLDFSLMLYAPARMLCAPVALFNITCLYIKCSSWTEILETDSQRKDISNRKWYRSASIYGISACTFIDTNKTILWIKPSGSLSPSKYALRGSGSSLCFCFPCPWPCFSIYLIFTVLLFGAEFCH